MACQVPLCKLDVFGWRGGWLFEKHLSVNMARELLDTQFVEASFRLFCVQSYFCVRKTYSDGVSGKCIRTRFLLLHRFDLRSHICISSRLQVAPCYRGRPATVG